jgi:hypothetical protein
MSDQFGRVTGPAEYIGTHGKGCCGPCYRNQFGVTYCSWCGATNVRGVGDGRSIRQPREADQCLGSRRALRQSKRELAVRS